MRKLLFRIMGLAFFIIMFTGVMTTTAWAVPELINYEGKLTDIEGISLNGTYDMTFHILNTEIGGEAMRSELQSVTVIDGIFNVLLGSVTPFPPGLFDTDELYLEVMVAGKMLSPRHRFTSSAFALKAKDADTIDGKHANELGCGAGDAHSLDAADGEPTDAVYVDDNGNVGIGTPSPGARLQVNGGIGLSSASHENIWGINHTVSMFNGVIGTQSNYELGLYYNYYRESDDYHNEGRLLKRGHANDDDTVGSIRVGEDGIIFAIEDLNGDESTSAGHNSGDEINWPTTRMVISPMGNVGIGRTSASEKLDVNGAVKAAAFVGDGSGLTGIAGGTGGVENAGSTTLGADTDSDGVGEIAFQTQNTTKMTVTNAGNVGIGTTSPTHQLTIQSSGRGSEKCGILFTDSNGDGRLHIYTSQDADGPAILDMADNNDNVVMRLQSNGNSFLNGGNIGIGTASPLRKLHIKDEVTSPVVCLQGHSVNAIHGGIVFYDESVSKKAQIITSLISGTIVLDYDGASGGTFQIRKAMDSDEDKVLQINSNGNVGIGTTNPGSYKLYVNGAAYSTGGWSGSDERWKKNIEPLEGALSKVNHLQGVSFDWRIDEYPNQGFTEERQIGFIAQDVEEVIPQVVKTNEDGYKSVSYERITAVLVEAVKIQQNRIEEIEIQNKELRKMVQNLLTRIEAIESKYISE